MCPSLRVEPEEAEEEDRSLFEWLAQRDAVVAQTAAFLKEAAMEESIRQWLAKNERASSRH